MSADLFAIFGRSNTSPAKEQENQTYAASQVPVLFAGTPRPREPVAIDGDVLFDADEAEAEDDFGDFEDVESSNDQAIESRTAQKHAIPESSMASTSQQFNLLDLGNDAFSDPVQEQMREPSFAATNETAILNETNEWGDFEDFAPDAKPAAKTIMPIPSSLISAQSTSLEPGRTVSTSREDDWNDFEEWSADQVSTQDAPSSETTTSTSRPRPDLPDEPRPVNIPPPTILLQLLPQVFEFVEDQAKSAQDPTEIDEIAASIVTIFAVSARLIAGRSLRWKRDTYLAQSTRIGPSTSGARSGGMKLTAVNKSEAIREEREAADVCDTWSRNTHVFAGVVSRSEHRRPWMNLNIKMAPRPSPGFGTLEARDPCALCGIKRDERIAGVDFDADDVFSDYWTEFWGHTDCKVFWYTYKDMLDHR